MPWQSQSGGGGGPWGGGGSGGGGGPWGRGPSGPGGGPRPPDFEDFIRKGQDRFRSYLPAGTGGGRGIALVVAALVILWLASGFYRIQENERGVVLRFGQWVSTTDAGLNWHWPYPIETVLTPDVAQVRQLQIGYRSQSAERSRDIAEESLMLTGDKNIIDIDFTVQWKIGAEIEDAGKYLFNIRDQESTVKVAAESAMREIIGQTDIQPALTEGRQAIEVRTQEELQRILDEYEAGILITEVKLQNVQPPPPVIDAFDDVQRANQDRARLRNQADAYRNDILPRARGEAQRMIQEAEAYKERLINEAEGEANRFTSVYEAYKQNPDVTRRRMYLETMQGVLSSTDKVILDRSAGVILGILAASALFTVPQTQQAIVLQLGNFVREVKEPGLHVKMPFIQTVQYYEKRVLNLDPSTERVILSGPMPLLVDSFVRYRIVDPLQFFKTVRTEQAVKDRLEPILNSSLRGLLGNVTLESLLSAERAEVMVRLREEVRSKSERFGIEVLDVRIRRADLPDEISQPVFEQMKSEREREAKEFRAQGEEQSQRIRASADREATVIRAEAQREAETLKGQGEGERTRILNDAYGQDAEFFNFYRSMQAYGEALGKDTYMVLSPDSEFFDFFGTATRREREDRAQPPAARAAPSATEAASPSGGEAPAN